MNGRGWAAMTTLPMKAVYLVGLHDGSEYVKSKSRLLPMNMTFVEIAAALDAYYQETTNATMPVPFALSYVKAKAEGATEAELEDMEAGMRRTLTRILEEEKRK
jgi:hypothetical protein